MSVMAPNRTTTTRGNRRTLLELPPEELRPRPSTVRPPSSTAASIIGGKGAAHALIAAGRTCRTAVRRIRCHGLLPASGTAPANDLQGGPDRDGRSSRSAVSLRCRTAMVISTCRWSVSRSWRTARTARRPVMPVWRPPEQRHTARFPSGSFEGRELGPAARSGGGPLPVLGTSDTQ